MAVAVPGVGHEQVRGTATERDYGLSGASHLFMLQGDSDGANGVAAWV